MRNVRLIARLDIKGPNLIKAINLEGLRVIGSPGDRALAYYRAGIDELLYMDCVASLYGRNHLAEIIAEAARDIFIPITVGGGIRSVADAVTVLRSGADKVAINTAAVSNPNLINELANRLGSQSVVLSIEAKRTGTHSWEVYTDNGRERSGLDVIDWVKQGIARGAGEVLVTSIDREGTRKGFDNELLAAVAAAATVPVIASGGMGEGRHALEAVNDGGVDAVAVADALHYERYSVQQLRKFCLDHGLNVRHFDHA